MVLKIYFAGSIRGGRQDAALYQTIIQHLQEHYGTVLTEHVGHDITDMGEQDKTEKWIHDRDMAWLEASQVVVAEVTQPSLGVGYEIGRALEAGKRILCLFRPSPERSLSAMIRGAEDGDQFRVVNYATLDDLIPVFRAYFSSLPQ